MISGGRIGKAIVLFIITLSGPFQIFAQANPDTYASTPTLKEVQLFFDAACVACHLEGGQNGGLVLEDGLTYEYLVGAKSTNSPLNRVQPGDPEKSYLIHKLRGTHLDVGGSGSRMPLGGSPIDPATLDMIEVWIRAGALKK